MKISNNNFKILTKTFAGLEEVLVNELQQIGASDIEILKRAVRFKGDKEILYKANFLCRTALRVLMPVSTFTVKDENDLYKQVQKIDWPKFLDLSDTFAVDAIVNNSVLTHSRYVALKTKDAIADQFRSAYKRRPSVDVNNPVLRINVHIVNNFCTVSLDSSGDSLHKRGYRKFMGVAPLNEALAAGLILLSGWDAKTNFIDPMCGSGTIIAEAAMLAKNIPPGNFRKNFGFMNWKDFDSTLWRKVVNESKNNYRDFKYKIIGSDINREMIIKAKQNMRATGLLNMVSLNLKSLEEQKPPEGNGVMITNPPYGERIKVDDIVKLYKSIGDALKKNYAGYDAWIISADNTGLKSVGLKPSKKIVVFNGPLECRFAKFEIYSGSRKKVRECANG